VDILIFNRDEERIADLNPESIRSPLIIEDKEGAMNFSFEYSIQEEDSTSLQEGNYVAFFDYHDEEWKAYEIVTKNENDQFIKVEGEHRFNELATEEHVSWNTNADSADIAIGHTLAGSRWKVGINESPRNLQRTVFEKNPLEALRFIEREWGGVLRFRIEMEGEGFGNFYVDLLERRGEFKGDRFEFGHNLKDFDHTVDFRLVKTALYGRGKGASIEGAEDTAQLTFADVEWKVANGDPIDKPLGQDWVGSEDKRVLYGKPDGQGGRLHIFGRYDSQAETPEGLLWETWFKLEEAYNPVVNVRGNVMDMASYSTTFKHEKASLGDEAYFIARYEGRSIELQAEIIRVERNPDKAEETVLEMGNYLPHQAKRLYEMEKNVSLQQARAGIYERSESFNPDGSLNTDWLEGVIDTVKNEVHSSVGFVYQRPEGMLILNDAIDASPTKAMLLSGGSFFLANGHTPEGEWDWRTFGDGDGFIADELVAGSIKTSLIEIFGDANFRWTDSNIYMIDPNDSQKQMRIGLYDGVDYGIAWTLDGGATWKNAFGFNGLKVDRDTIFEEGYDPSKIKIGARNLILGTNDAYTTVTVGAYHYELQAKKPLADLGLMAGNQVTLSFFARVPIEAPNGVQPKFSFYKADGTYVSSWGGELIFPNAEGFTTFTDTIPPDTTEIAFFVHRTGFGDTALPFDIEIARVQAESGNRYSDWRKAPEDIDSELDARIETVTSAYNTAIETATGEINLSVNKTLYGDPNDPNDTGGLEGELKAFFGSELTQTETSMNLKFTQIDGTTQDHEGKLAEVYSYFNFSEAGLNIGKSDSPLQINISNEQMDFIDNGQVVAYVNGQKMYIDSLEVLTNAIIGNHKFEKYNSDITLIKWVGG
jgi:phage minor structural protein